MIKLVPIDSNHHEALYQICLVNEHFARDLIPTFSHFVTRMQGMDGFTVMDDDNIIGAIAFSDYVPYTDILMHVTIDRKFKGRWMNRRIIRQVFRYIFEELDLPRVSGYAISGITISARIALEALGFKLEGIKEMSCLRPDGYHDLWLYGLLRSRCRWL